MRRLHLQTAAVLIMIFMLLMPYFALAADDSSEGEQKYYYGDPVNAGNDTGFSLQNEITADDPHYGWELGEFLVSNYTRSMNNEDGQLVFLKNVGDEIELSFELRQNIDMLKEDASLSIADDKKSYDSYFGIEETSFGRGALIIRKTDYQNFTHSPEQYINYLTGVSVGAQTNILLLEEGDYEVALDYSVRYDPRNILGLSIFPEYSDYQIFFTFSVRNGNTMVYPLDVETDQELFNTSITENGFYLDLLNSRYLDIDVKKEVLRAGEEGLVEDARFNRPAKDGEIFTDEGVYTFTVSNRYTGQSTTKKIYVGTNEVLRAYVTTNLSIEEIEEQIAGGATINDDGTINAVAIHEESSPETTDSENSSPTDAETDISNVGEEGSFGYSSIVIIAVGLAMFLIVIVVIKKKAANNKNKESDLNKDGE